MRAIVSIVLLLAAVAALSFGETAKGERAEISVKPILFWSAIGAAGIGAGLNVWAFLDNGAVGSAKSTYENAIDDHDVLFTKYIDLANGANAKYVFAGVCYFIAAGLFMQWMLTPDMPLVTVVPSFGSDTVAMNIIARY
ncbi:MAG: hypothetical protein AABZ39_18910 [Spirochaetota bacterium]